ncbi:MAG: PH domain-containing protein, partial [Pseudomonadota bacterium]|nr:PH domain-containing protein [Pseudomonadota bacterium]
SVIMAAGLLQLVERAAPLMNMNSLPDAAQYAILFLPLAALVPAIMITIRRATTVYLLTNQRLLVTWGFASRTTEGVELYRIRDYRLASPPHLYVLGLSRIRIESTDKTTPQFYLYSLPNGALAYELLRDTIIDAQRKSGYRQFEIG